MIKKVLFFTFLLVSHVHVHTMKLEKERIIEHLSNNLKKVITCIKRKSINLAIKYIDELPKHALNDLFRFEYIHEWHDKEGFKVTEKEYINGLSLLHLAVLHGCWQLIKPLYKRGACLLISSSRETGSVTPLLLAMKKKDWDCAGELLSLMPTEMRKNSLFLSRL